MPNITGMYWTEAEPLLRAAGWAGVLDKEPNLADSGYSTNQIAFQSPSPGHPIEPATRITLRFAD
ncbi:PASTA domain-containing protein [Micromonospora sp. WMMD737]|uniref:PASTA domain-containing protein n=1 Tax=Micromonospora sp. WMMD737 TaxID=3404113 RepID=UPI003B940EA4